MIIFVVDDERIIASTLALILREHDFDARAFYDGQSALIAAAFCEPDLLLTDVLMPGMDGLTLAAALITMHSACEVLFLSAHVFISDINSLNATKEWKLLEKPIHPLQLVETVTSLQSARLRNVKPSN